MYERQHLSYHPLGVTTVRVSPTYCMTERDRKLWVAEMHVARVATVRAINPIQGHTESVSVACIQQLCFQ